MSNFDQCCICTTKTSAIHWHHTIPQALGGTDGIQIPLCGDCHTTLHKKADANLAAMKGSKKKPLDRYWSKFEDEQRAEPWFKVLLASMLNPPVSQDEKLTLLPSIKVDPILRVALDVLKLDLKCEGVTNISQVLLFCIKHTLKTKGIPHEKQQQHADKSSRYNKQNKRNSNSSRLSKMW